MRGRELERGGGGRSSLVPRSSKALEREREGRNKTTAHIQSSGIKLIVDNEMCIMMHYHLNLSSCPTNSLRGIKIRYIHSRTQTTRWRVCVEWWSSWWRDTAPRRRWWLRYCNTYRNRTNGRPLSPLCYITMTVYKYINC